MFINVLHTSKILYNFALVTTYHRCATAVILSYVKMFKLRTYIFLNKKKIAQGHELCFIKLRYWCSTDIAQIN